MKFAKILGKENVRQGFFGQEINLTTYNLCRINMFLHDIDFDKFDIGHGDTLTDPLHWDDEPFEAIVSNPPYSINWDGDSNPLLINDPRFSPAGVLAPKSKADLAFIMHSLSWLTNWSDNTISMYSRNTSTGALTALGTPTIATGSNPWGIAMSPDSTSVYVTNNNSGTISMYSRNTSTGALTALTTPTITTGVTPRGITVSADGTSVYVTNYGSNIISMYSRN